MGGFSQLRFPLFKWLYLILSWHKTIKHNWTLLGMEQSIWVSPGEKGLSSSSEILWVLPPFQTWTPMFFSWSAGGDRVLYYQWHAKQTLSQCGSCQGRINLAWWTSFHFCKHSMVLLNACLKGPENNILRTHFTYITLSVTLVLFSWNKIFPSPL